MAVAKSKSTQPAAGEASEGQNAIELLKADHKEVAAMFEQFNSGDLDQDEKDELAEEICKALTVHTQIEEEIFYPAAREAVEGDDEDLLDEAEVEHGSITELVAAVEGHEDDALFDAQVKVMSEWVKHHVKEEEEKMFPKVEETDLDLDELGAQLAARKQELMSDDEDEAEGEDEGEEDEGEEDEGEEDEGEEEEA